MSSPLNSCEAHNASPQKADPALRVDPSGCLNQSRAAMCFVQAGRAITLASRAQHWTAPGTSPGVLLQVVLEQLHHDVMLIVHGLAIILRVRLCRPRACPVASAGI